MEQLELFPNEVGTIIVTSDKPQIEFKVGGIRDTTGKPPVNLVLSKALFEVARVAEFGAKKYSAHNYRKGMRWSFFVDAAVRHLVKYCTGEKTDVESGLSHLSHVCWNTLALLEFEVEKLGQDDIFPGYDKI